MDAQNRSWRCGSFVMLVLAFSVSMASAQNTSLASLQGTVTDESAAPMPGVTVNVTGPALQVPQISVVTDGDGSYRIENLPVGVYRVAYELTGFQSYIREDLRLTVGFAGRVDVVMKVGALEESITVSGQSPVVDTVSTTSSTTFQRELLESTPRGRGLWDLIPLASGVSTRGAPDVGDSNLGSRQDISSYGVYAQPSLEIEGINVQTDDSNSSAVYLSYFSFDEVQVRAAGHTAEVGQPGANLVAVVKSGGNQFHGTYTGSWQSPKFQSSNITPELQAQGLSQTNPLKHYYDIAGDLGGRVVRDKVWFYAGLSRQDLSQGQIGFASAPGPDNVYLTADDVPGDVVTRLDNGNLKTSYQVSTSTKLIGVWEHFVKFAPAFGATRLRPMEAQNYYNQAGDVWKGELQSAPRGNLLFDVLGGFGGYFADYQVQPGLDTKGNPSKFNQANGLYTGPNAQPAQRPQRRYQARGSMSYFPADDFLGGRHQLKVGTALTWENGGSGFIDKASGNYLLTYNGANPIQIDTYNYPVFPINRMNTFALFATDSWKIDRFTLNLGVRYDHSSSFYPTQEKEPGVFGTSGSVAASDILTWNRVVPRLGLSWDVRGTGRSVVKATYALYSPSMGTLFSQLYNPNALVTTVYRWSDPNRNGDYDPGEVNLDPLGGDYLSQSGGITQILNPDLRQPVITEYTGRLEQELMPNVALSVNYVYKKLHDQYNKSGLFSTSAGVNVLRPYEVYTVPVPRIDPGPDGRTGTGDDGDALIVWDYPAAYRGAAFNGPKIVNNPDGRDDTYNSLEVAFTKRYSRRWNMMASFWSTKNHQWIQATPQSPNDDRFPLNETWTWEGRLNGSYTFPHGFQLSTLLRTQSGIPGQRTFIFTGLPQSSNLTLRMEPYGARRGPAITVMNVRAGKRFPLGGSRRFELSFEIFNLLNSSAATTTNYASGSSFGFTTGVVSPRVARIGSTFSF